MSCDKFDIIDYIASLSGFVFDKAVLQRIALDRQVLHHEPDDLTQEQKDLLRADLLYTAYLSPSVWASQTHSHGSFSSTTGSQSIFAEDKERIYNIALSIYKKYNDKKLEEVFDSGTLQWL